MRIVIIPANLGDLCRTPPCLSQQLLGRPDRSAGPCGDLPYPVAFDALHPQHLLLWRRQLGQDLLHRDACDVVRRIDRTFGRLFIDDAPFLAPVVHTRVANGPIEPRLGMLDVGAVAGLETAQEDIVDEPLRFISRDAELLLGIRAQPVE